MTENEMAGWHHQLDGHEFEQAPAVGDGQGSLSCYSPWGHKESDKTEQLNQIYIYIGVYIYIYSIIYVYIYIQLYIYIIGYMSQGSGTGLVMQTT